MNDKVITVDFSPQPARGADDKIFERNPYVYLDEAACWVAFRTFDRPNSVGPSHISRLLDKQEALGHAFDTADAKYYLAFEQILNAMTRGLIRCYGRMRKREEGEEEIQKLDDMWDDGLTRLIPVHEFQQQPPLMMDEDTLVVGEHFYETVVLEWQQVRTVFGPFVLEYGSTELGEKKPASPLLRSQPAPEIAGQKRGRPDKWNWHEILTEVILLANSQQGLPETQAELEAWVAEKCMELFGSEPGTSTVRLKIGPIYQRLRRGRQ